MFNEQDFLKEEKRCAKLLGMTLEEYKKYKNNVKVPAKKKQQTKKYDNSILKKLGLEIGDLKRRKVI